MQSPYRFTILLAMLIGYPSLAQRDHDYEADSTLYTPIPKPSRQTTVRRKVGSWDTLVQKPFQYFFSLRSGSIHGDQISFTTSMIHGVTLMSQLRVGLGLGFDSYVDVTVAPLFASVSWDLWTNKNALFLAFNGGKSKAWKHEYYAGQELRNFNGGYMINPELGYRIRYHDLRLGISIGWKVQRLKYYYEYFYSGYWDPVNGWVPGEPNRTTVKEDKRRVAVNLFIGWK